MQVSLRQNFTFCRAEVQISTEQTSLPLTSAPVVAHWRFLMSIWKSLPQPFITR